MKTETARVVLILWLAFCHVIIPPTAGLQTSSSRVSGNNGNPSVEDLYEELKHPLASAVKLSTEKDNLKASYKDWLQVTAKTLESVDRLRNEIIQLTQRANYLSLGGSALAITGGVLGILGAVTAVSTGGLSLLIIGGSSFAVGGVGIGVGNGLYRYAISKELCNVATIYMETSKQNTVRFNEKVLSYFEALEKFKDFFNDIRNNNAAILLFYKIVQSDEFLQNLNLDKQSEKKLRDLLLQIIEIDISKIKPYMWALEFPGNVYDGAKNLAVKIKSILSDLKNMFEGDPFSFIIVENVIKEYSDDLLKTKDDIQSLGGSDGPTLSVPLIDSMGLGIDLAHSSRLLKEKAIKLKYVISELLQINKASLVTLNALLIAGEIVIATETVKNLKEGSKSVESEEILKVIDKLVELRNKVIKEMEVSFGW